VADELNSNVEILPSAVFVRDVPVKDYSIENEKIVIGWVGGKINLPYLQLMQPVLKKLSESYPIELCIVCDEGLEMDGVDVRFVPWTLEGQDTEIAKFDIGIMPLADSLHASGKCAYKALQYMAAAVPAVVSDVGVNRDVLQNGQLGGVAETVDDFYAELEQLIKDPDKRKEMGLASRKLVEAQYSIEAVAAQLAQILKARISKN
ncbi:MAG: glycosyltransferase family 4 protein, partial [Gammaproteobacteria bacterium]|nr:glycosyltransferase family 4 protein [Gammaproteobacteria bacterium]